VSGHLYMLDTNICSFAMRLHPNVLRGIEAGASRGRVVISALVYSELLDGTLGPKASPKLPEVLAAFLPVLGGVVAWDRAAAEQTAQVRRHLRLAGTPISPNDSAIAGHALALGAILVTNNTREFARVPGLRLEDWTLLRG